MTPPLYLYTGTEFGRRDDAVTAVKNSLSKKLGEVDFHLFYLIETPFSEVMTLLQSGTLFSSGVCVVCKNAELLKKKEELEMISSWLSNNPDETSTLILVSDENKIDAKLEKLVPPANRKKFWEMKGEELVSWLADYFKKNDYSIDFDAIGLMVEMTDGNTQALRNEAERFFACFPKKHNITCEDIEAVLVNNREESPFSLFNYMCDTSVSPEKRFENAIGSLQKIRLADEKSAGIIALLSSCFRKLIIWHKLCDGGYEPDDFTLKTNGFAGQLMRQQYRRAAKIWTTGQTTAILADLASTDMEIRSSGALLEDILLQKLLYEIVIKKGASLSEYES